MIYKKHTTAFCCQRCIALQKVSCSVRAGIFVISFGKLKTCLEPRCKALNVSEGNKTEQRIYPNNNTVTFF